MLKTFHLQQNGIQRLHHIVSRQQPCEYVLW